MKERWSKRKCLVTGVGGFVTSHLATHLASLGAEVVGIAFKEPPRANLNQFAQTLHATILYGDVTDEEFLRDVFDSFPIDTCFHLTASAIISHATHSPLATFRTNILGTCNVLEAARNGGRIERVVVASSDKAYGCYPENQLPYQEHYDLRGRGVYECSKACADNITRAYAFNFDLPVVVTRCSNIYGPGDPNWSRVIPATIMRLLQGKAPFIYEGSQAHQREYTYIGDIVEAYLLLAEEMETTRGQAYNIGSGEVHSTREVVEQILQQMGSALQPLVVKKATPFWEIPAQYLSNARIRSLGWIPKVSWEEGLDRTIQWYRREGQCVT